MIAGALATFRWELIREELWVEGNLGRAGYSDRDWVLHVHVVKSMPMFVYMRDHAAGRGFTKERHHAIFNRHLRAQEYHHIDTLYSRLRFEHSGYYDPVDVARIAHMSTEQAHEEFYALARKVLKANPNNTREVGSKALLVSLKMSGRRKAKDKVR